MRLKLVDVLGVGVAGERRVVWREQRKRKTKRGNGVDWRGVEADDEG